MSSPKDNSAGAFALFAQWLDADADARITLLENIARQDASLHQRLLALIRADHDADRAAFLIDNAMLDVATTHAPLAEADVSGQRFGAWILERTIGTGGMGQVWLAHRADGQHAGVAAIKMLRMAIADTRANQRFAQEGRILAQLSHPHIAMLLDAGFSSDGQRYLVLEYVDGQRIDQWCDARRLDLHARIQLFLQVCAAVAHAHAHLIVHRDLKPSNILVLDDGNAKLLDFGIAKLLEVDNETAAGLTGETFAALTPGYAAPEQITGAAITIATDVYALGVILFVLLGGRNPHGSTRATPVQFARAVVDGEPKRLSDFDGVTDLAAVATARAISVDRLRSALRGDLEIIVANAMKKLPAQRYANVQAFADDLRRHLENRPIAARADSSWYRLRKFARRNWLPLVASAALMMVVIGSAVIIAAQARQTAREAQSTLAVKDFLFGLFIAVDPTIAKGRDISARELLDRGREHLDADAHGDPALKAELQSVLGRIYSQLGHYSEAADLQKHALDSVIASDDTSLRRVIAELDYGATLRSNGDFAAAKSLVEAAHTHLQALSKVPAEVQVRVMTSVAEVHLSQRDFATSKKYADAAVAITEHSAVSNYMLGQAHWTRANAEWGLHSSVAAEADYREALRLMTMSDGADSPLVGRLHGNIAMALRGQSRYAQALEESEKGLAIETKSLAPDHPSLLVNRGYLALTHFLLGHYRQAREIFEEVDALQRKVGGDDAPARAGTLANLGSDLIEIPDLAAAEKTFAESMRVFEKKYGRAFDGTQTALKGLASAHVLQGRLDIAKAELIEVQQNIDKQPSNGEVANYYWRGEVARAQHDFEAAVALDRQALQIALKNYGEIGRYPALAHHYLGLALRDAGKIDEAELELRAALSAFGYIEHAFHPWAATTRIELAQLLATRKEGLVESQRLITEAVTIREQFFGADDARSRAARSLLLRTPDQH
ncbi:tetratricopeptide repeat protein [Pseudolysobacter antarcticus]|uniref:Tetratricopeptide repeat protein n=1 Tax=Pseudolysobacter antarcticus TaxID=2511995 RepID=A0A411HL69_9GAMM|nr:serine/threonine-protein kinase [Pseudolysobacter antarcticus]QBB71243.1 tetratricopeptide repeat protein [Pseudolysobacter antarcticus]